MSRTDGAQSKTSTGLPRITVIMPVRNEEEYIEQSVYSVWDNGYPQDLIQILVVDGESDDATARITEELSQKINVKLLNNPDRVVPTALNLAIVKATGEIIFRLDGHAFYIKGFLRKAVDFLLKHPEYDCVGGPIETIGLDRSGNSIKEAMSSPIGVGNSMFRIGDYEGEVDSVAFGGYRREVFDRIGMFNEELVRNQDDEFNYRLRKHGGKIYMLREFAATYYSRATLKKLWRQYFQYGFWKIRVMQLLGQVPSWRSVVPLLFLLTLFAGLVLSAFGFVWPLLALVGCYLLTTGYAVLSTKVSRNVSRSQMWQAILTMHFSYGLGELLGILRFVFRIRSIQSQTKLSR